ncbi:hypothetical protein COBT_001503, partial [Conglomerata obtusa]
MVSDELYLEVVQLNNSKISNFYCFIKRLERQNSIIEEQNKEIESLIIRVVEENTCLEKNIKELLSKGEKMDW